MTDGRRTLFEFHLHDADLQIGPRTIGLGSGDEADGENESEDDDGSEVAEDGRNTLALAVGLLVVAAVVGLALRRLLADGDLDAMEALDEEAPSS
ncbi:MAG: hypothetical protein ABEJ79_01730 [Halolamina sp.]